MNRVLTALPQPWLLVVNLLLVGILAVLDYWSRANLSLNLLYVIPIAVTTWYLGRRVGWGLVGLSAIAAYGGDLGHGVVPWAPSLLWNTAMSLGLFGLIAYLITRLKSATEVSQQLMRLDVTTGAINRPFFLELLEAEYHRCERYHYPVTLACLEIEHLSQASAQAGNLQVERLLNTLVEKLSGQLRANDVVARYCENGFVILLPQADETQSRPVVTRLYEDTTALTQVQALGLKLRIAAVTFMALPDSSPELLDYTARRLHRLQARPSECLDHYVVKE